MVKDSDRMIFDKYATVGTYDVDGSLWTLSGEEVAIDTVIIYRENNEIKVNYVDDDTNVYHCTPDAEVPNPENSELVILTTGENQEQKLAVAFIEYSENSYTKYLTAYGEDIHDPCLSFRTSTEYTETE